MKKYFIFGLFLLSAFTTTIAQTTLAPGDIAVIGFNMDKPNVVKFVNLVDITAGTQIKFTDNGWNGSALLTSEGTDTWTATANYPKGTILSLTPSSMILDTKGDQIFIYQGAASSPSFIFGLSTKTWITGSISKNTSRLPSTLVAGTTAIAFTVERDNGKYNKVTTNGDKATILSYVANLSNWTTTDAIIKTFPAWVFSFPGTTTGIEPTAQPTSLTFSSIKSYKYNVAFSPASPAPSGYLVVRTINAMPNGDPQDGTFYKTGDAIGNGKVVSAGTSTAFLQESVVANTFYGYKIYSYNTVSSQIDYLQTSPLSGYVTSNATEEGSYYNGLSPISQTFIADLENRVRNPHTRISYDLYDENMIAHYEFADTTGGQKVAVCVYSGQRYSYTPPFVWYTSSPFSREHTWCQSWMPSSPSSSYFEYCDLHHLFPVYQSKVNAVRSNHPLGEVVTVISSYLNGKYGYDANGNLVYEPQDSQKGNSARALLYMSLRYNGINGFDWTFNNLNNNILPSLSEGPQDLDVLLNWNSLDPPDNYEIARNDYVQSLQQNRNPFIDRPDWVNYIDFNTLTLKQLYKSLENQTENINEKTLKLFVYPNPLEDAGYLNINNIDEAGTAEVSLMNIYGKKVYSGEFYLLPGINTIEFNPSLSAGTYILFVIKGNQSGYTKLIVE